MYNLLIALLLAAVTFTAVTLGLGWVAALFPAFLVLGVAMFLLTRRTGNLVQAELATIQPLLEQRRVDEAETKLVRIKEKYGRWQFLLAGQIDSQLGVLDYVQRKFDTARPKLEAGKWRNGPVLACIAALDWRQGRKDEAWKGFAAAASAASTDANIYQVWATLLVRDGKRAEALAALSRGLEALPKHHGLRELKNRVANDQKIDVKAFGEGWYQYFPEDLLQEAVMRGTRGPSPFARPQPQAPRPGARHAPRR